MNAVTPFHVASPVPIESEIERQEAWAIIQEDRMIHAAIDAAPDGTYVDLTHLMTFCCCSR